MILGKIRPDQIWPAGVIALLVPFVPFSSRYPQHLFYIASSIISLPGAFRSLAVQPSALLARPFAIFLYLVHTLFYSN
ncbi:uncharacterized protein BDW70DRAFT_125661 [Aspergillus foveolatus]|uniref:uncharacterized protein n=1 Tax=Aspergillus foveolatus TaxID=210207 RepID=UPI003CCCB77A